MTDKKLTNYYLINNDEDGELKYKLFLTQSDRDTLIRMLDKRDLPDNSSKRLVENFNFFEKEIENINTEVIFNGLSKIIVIDVSLDRERDNPQLIFESLNSTGLALSQADLIRNFILMGLAAEDQAVQRSAFSKVFPRVHIFPKLSIFQMCSGLSMISLFIVVLIHETSFGY